jgi:hypothetical protein
VLADVVPSKTATSHDRAATRAETDLTTPRHRPPQPASPRRRKIATSVERVDICEDVRRCALADRGSYWLSYAPLMLVFTRKTGQSVQASDATVVGRLRDLTARLGAEHPTVHRLAIGSRRHVTALLH